MRFLTLILIALVCVFAMSAPATACDPALPILSPSFAAVRVSGGYGVPLYGGYDANFALQQELLFRARATPFGFPHYSTGTDVRVISPVAPVTIFQNGRLIRVFP